jgi:hypothetical protein
VENRPVVVVDGLIGSREVRSSASPPPEHRPASR